jgi:hypothetical protein
MLESHSNKELKTYKGDEYYLTKQTLGFELKKKSFKKKIAHPIKDLKIGFDKTRSKYSSTLHLDGLLTDKKDRGAPTDLTDAKPSLEEDKDEASDEEMSTPQQEVLTLLLKDGRRVCGKCSGQHDTADCFRKTICSHCGDQRHNVINCFKLCKCRMLLAFKPDLIGVPHVRSEQCSIDWDVLLEKLINKHNPLN